MNKAVYPGSFDPITYGHIDVIKRSSKIFDEVIVVVLSNCEKKSVFSIDEKIEMIKLSLQDVENVKVISYEGLTTDIVKAENASTIIRGIRNTTDFEYEYMLSQIYKTQANVETIFIPTSKEYIYLSSTVVRDYAAYHGDLSKFVPEEIIPIIEGKYNNKES